MLDGLCIVVSPLISLMKDQVDADKANDLNAEFLNSSLLMPSCRMSPKPKVSIPWKHFFHIMENFAS